MRWAEWRGEVQLRGSEHVLPGHRGRLHRSPGAPLVGYCIFTPNKPDNSVPDPKLFIRDLDPQNENQDFQIRILDLRV